MGAGMLALSGLLGAGGSIAGGLLGQGGTGGQGKTSYYNPGLDYANQVAQYAALDPLGFGMISNIPDPFQQLIGQIQSAPMDNKTRRRAMIALDFIRQDPTLLTDPYGRGFTRDEIYQANKTGAPFGRYVQKASESDGNTEKGAAAGAGAGAYFGPMGMALGAGIGALIGRGKDNDTKPVALPIRNVGRLATALQSAGISLSDLQDVLKRQAQFKEQIARLEEKGLGRLNEDTILNRAQASSAAAALLGDAGRFATGADPTEFQSGLMDRIRRNIDEQEQAYLLRAQYAGVNPGVGMQQFQNMRQDSDITALTQAVQAASALMGGLSGATAGAQNAAQQSSQASLGALSAATNQAMAANQLRAQAAMNRSDSMANGISGAFNSLSQAAALPYLAGLNGNTGKPGVGQESGFSYGPGSTANQIATDQARMGWSPYVSFWG